MCAGTMTTLDLMAALIPMVGATVRVAGRALGQAHPGARASRRDAALALPRDLVRDLVSAAAAGIWTVISVSPVASYSCSPLLTVAHC